MEDRSRKMSKKPEATITRRQFTRGALATAAAIAAGATLSAAARSSSGAAPDEGATAKNGVSRGPGASARGAAWKPWPFYVMDTGLVGPDVPTLADKVKLAHDLGFRGIDYSFNPDGLPRTIELLDKARLELTAIYTSPRIEDPLDPKLADSIKLLKGRPTRIEMALQSRRLKSSDPKGDRQALALIDRVSDLCGDSGPVVSIYPHTGAWAERVEDGVRLAKASGRANVGANFNLVHWKWVRQTRDQEQTLRDALPKLFLVSINGLAGNAIVPLNQGDYDLLGFLRRLKHVGYTGRVGLQGYGIHGPSRTHLAASMKKWREMMNSLTPPSSGAPAGS